LGWSCVAKHKFHLDAAASKLHWHFANDLNWSLIYQHLMDYWADVMQDDCYAIVLDSWKAETYRVIEKDKKGKEKDKGWACDLIPKRYIAARFFAKEQAEIDRLIAEFEISGAALA